MPTDWLYPISAELDRYAFEVNGYQQPTTFSAFVDEYEQLVRTGQDETNWHLAVNGHDAEDGDRVWAYSCSFNGDQGVCGLAEIAWRDVPAKRIGLRWDMATTGLLIADPLPGPELRAPFGQEDNFTKGQRKRALWRLGRLGPMRVVLLEHHVLTRCYGVTCGP